MRVVPDSSRWQGDDREQSVLGSILLDESVMAGLPPLRANDFEHPAHQLIFSAIKERASKALPIDPLSVAEHLGTSGLAAQTGGVKYLHDLAMSVASPKNASSYADKVIEQSRKRAMQAALSRAQQVIESSQDADKAFEQLESLVADAKEATSERTSAFKLLTADDLRSLPTLPWRVKGVLPAQGLAAIFGPSTSGKSFLGFDLLTAVARGADWFGHRVKPTSVVYIPLEGEAGFRLRAAAWEAANESPLPPNLFVVLQPFKLVSPGDIAALADVVAAVGSEPVIVIDTLNRAAPEADENSSADMGRIIDAAKTLQSLTGGLVILVHHSGKDAAKGMRGHSSLFAALDTVIEVNRIESCRSWKVSKSKDGRDGDTHHFSLKVVELGEDEDDEPITSCVVAVPEWEDTLAPLRVRPPKGGNQRIVYDALGPLLRASESFGRAGAPPMRPCIPLDDAIAGTKDRLAVEPKRRGERARQAITGLIASGVVGSNEGWLWLV